MFLKTLIRKDNTLVKTAIVLGIISVSTLQWSKGNTTVKKPTKENDTQSINHPDSYWKSKLDPEVYKVTRCSATEAPFSGKYWNNHEDGLYRCSNCGAVLFDSKDKYDSGTGWPSFTKPQTHSVASRKDLSHAMVRTEVVCKHCGAHLGHVFDDGPTPTGQRFCINSASLNFDKHK